MASTEEILYYVAIATVLGKEKKSRVIRSRWLKLWLRKTCQHSNITLSGELRFQPEDWHNYLRMNEDIYLNILSMVTTLIKKQEPA
jgi:hypothetical protein